MKKPLGAAALLGLLALGPALADFSVYKQDGPFLVPIRADRIALEQEDLQVKMDVDQSRIDASFVLRNDGPAQKVQVGFPQVVLPGTTGWGSHLKPFQRYGVWNASLEVDGQPRPFRESLGAWSGADPGFVSYRTPEGKTIKLPIDLGSSNLQIDGKRTKLKWLSWELGLEPHQRLGVRVGYNLENQGYHSTIGLEYLLKTGGLWSGGRIGHLTMGVALGSNITLETLQGKPLAIAGGSLVKAEDGSRVFYRQYEVTEVQPKGWSVEDRSLRWDLSRFKPENLVVRARGLPPIYASSVLQDALEYGPQNVLDGDIATAWVGAHPTGDTVFVPICRRRELLSEVYVPPVLEGVRIFAGYGKSEDLFQANNRPRTITVLGTKFQLEDKFGYQELTLPAGQQIKYYETQLPVQIVDVYPGSRYDDTCISEIEPIFKSPRNAREPGKPALRSVATAGPGPASRPARTPARRP